MRNLYELNPRRLWVKYAFALALILCFLIGSHFLHLSVISESSKDAQTINIAGQQRMLSQRIALKSERTLSSSDVSEISNVRSLLESAAKQFESNHNWLLEHSVISDAAKRMYFSADGANIDRHTNDYLAVARTVLSTQNVAELKDIISRLNELENMSLLKKLDDAVTLFANESEHKINRLEFFQLISLIVAIITILAEALLIFYPAQRGINKTLDFVEDQNRNVTKQNKDLISLSQVLNHEVNYDALTGLKNRRAVKEDLDVLIQGYQQGSQIFVLMVDLDEFKDVNDTFGYPVGDLVLKYVADVIKSLCSELDTVARVGGDEFVILIESSSRLGDERIQKLGEEIISVLKQPFVLHGNAINIGASIGYSVAEEFPIDGARLISDADIALRKSKALGKGVVSLYSINMRLALEERAKLLIDLVRAIEQREFIAYLQPQISFHDGRIIGFEVLGRWDHPERGILSPANFIPMAEEIGLIDQIDEMVAMAGLDLIAQLRSNGYEIPKISVNVSAHSLRRPNFCSEFTKSLKSRGLMPGDVLIEVLETTLIEKSGDQVISTVTELSRAGYGIAIDDFGTGYSSLSMVVKLDISELKIDRSLVLEMDSRKGQEALEAIVALAKRTNLTVVAEGIETTAQFVALKAIGCDVAQGFKFGYPMSMDDTRTWIDNYGKATIHHLGYQQRNLQLN